MVDVGGLVLSRTHALLGQKRLFFAIHFDFSSTGSSRKQNEMPKRAKRANETLQERWRCVLVEEVLVFVMENPEICQQFLTFN